MTVCGLPTPVFVDYLEKFVAAHAGFLGYRLKSVIWWLLFNFQILKFARKIFPPKFLGIWKMRS